MQVIAISADHGGFQMKQELVPFIESLGCKVLDLGAFNFDATDDYPVFAQVVSEAVALGEAQKGIVICGSGVGASITSNKFKGIRAGLCHDTYSAHQGVEHDDMNVLCMGARIIGIELAKEITNAFISASFSDEERHERRLSKVLSFEDANFK